uniref:Uncharacterized protein n=1 Tax=Cuerna arida TaxID=1464854 RepID=A0A1B6F3Y5_9HEMI
MSSTRVIPIEREMVENITFTPRRSKTKQEIEQEFLLSLRSYEQEEITVSGKVRVPSKKRRDSSTQEASAEMTIVREYDFEDGPNAVHVVVRRRSSAASFNLKDFGHQFEEQIIKQHGNILGQQDDLDIEMSWKPKVSPI